MDLKSTGVITFDEWYKFSMEHIFAKTTTLYYHPILDHGNTEQFKPFLRLDLLLAALRRMSSTGTCWNSSLSMMMPRMALSP